MVTKEVALDLYRRLVRIRTFEEKAAELWHQGHISGELHLYSGQEAVSAGVCAHLRPEDPAAADHRGHGPLLAKGVDFKKMMAELLGRKTGLCQGKGGHMHLFDPSVSYGCGSIIGAAMPLALGPALAAKMQKRDLVSVVFFGEGAANQGTFHESLNLAALWKLPVLFVCHDNRWAVSVPKAQSTAVPWNADRASAYGIPGVLVDGMDAVAVYEAAGPLVQRARRGEGPGLLEATCYRFRGHFETDPLVYLPQGEMEEWKAKDPIPKLERQIIEHGYGADQDLKRISEEIRAQVEEAADFALSSPWPEPELATQHVFV